MMLSKFDTDYKTVRHFRLHLATVLAPGYTNRLKRRMSAAAGIYQMKVLKNSAVFAKEVGRPRRRTVPVDSHQ